MIFLSRVSLVAISTVVFSVPLFASGREMSCNIEKCQDFNPSTRGNESCSADEFKIDRFTNVDSQDEVQWFEEDVIVSSNGVKYTKESSTVFDFSDGDQINTFSFDTKELGQFLSNQTSSVTANYIEGYYWADGFHVSLKKVLNCH